jgi:hypothetical protein
MFKMILTYFFFLVKKKRGLTIHFFGFIIRIGICGKRVPFFREAGGCEPPIGLFSYRPDVVPQEMAAHPCEKGKRRADVQSEFGWNRGIISPRGIFASGCIFFTP